MSFCLVSVDIIATSLRNPAVSSLSRSQAGGTLLCQLSWPKDLQWHCTLCGGLPFSPTATLKDAWADAVQGSLIACQAVGFCGSPGMPPSCPRAKKKRDLVPFGSPGTSEHNLKLISAKLSFVFIPMNTIYKGKLR